VSHARRDPRSRPPDGGHTGAGLDLDRHLTTTCADLVQVLGVAAAVVVVFDPRGAHVSDGAAVLIGETQLGAAVGPVANVLRSQRSLLTPDLLRVGPPPLAAIASDCGLVSSGAVPLRALDRLVGAVQLLGSRERPVDSDDLERLAPLLDVLAAQLVDVAALSAAVAPAVRRPAPRPRAPRQLADPEPETTALYTVPAPRSGQPRHSAQL